ncbi:Ubiquitin-like-specific protease 2 OS=Schizosaccharomyces pombe (strain 972 / ATCC 24843) GN=ulp2 PE=1 SV=2 [Rhizoctonia solani AG-1 IB]|uniref:Ubiquitin-like-specific protease 2 n=1 Tax=Thanatephorus cucumeris (strain AG1-IB / isolate 7/3/14) TaxID=1108050 RepID=A0A0B7F651_THACB|nr:Ubiquitin-like-specific protease 2 OS=Schizosaccharomyces pombe (strain 972 / ATCC 24843) GN=ulp2 PE=1 SV=2 [Rhizoctonia solani AG-1 IB]
MASRNERQAISALHIASNGQSDTSQDSGKKRLREDDNSTSGTSRRRTARIGGPFSGIGQSNLQEHRGGSGRVLKRDNDPIIKHTDNRSNRQQEILSSKAFQFRTGVLDEPPGRATHGAKSHSPFTRQSPPKISKDISDKMDGASDNEAMFSFSTMLEVAPIPETPKGRDRGLKESETSTVGHSPSDSDPMDCIGDAGNTVNPINGNPHQNDVDDDEIVECEPPPTSTQGPSTPKGTPIVKKGTVKDAVRKFETKPLKTSPARNKPNLDSYLAPKSNRASTAFAPAAYRASSSQNTPSGPTSKGKPIAPGITRLITTPGKVSERMQKKPAPNGKNQTSQLKIQSVDTQPSREQKPPQHTKPRENKSQNIHFTLEIQEWYCEPRHYESNANPGSYSMTFNGSMIKIAFYERPKVNPKALCLLPLDVERFEVVDAAEDEAYLWMVIHLKNQVVAKANWKRDGLGDSNVVFLHFLGSDDPDIHDRWRGLIQGMAKWSKKDTIRKTAMDALVKDATDRSSQINFHLPKVQDNNSPSREGQLKIDHRTRTTSPPSKPRTRSTISSSNLEYPKNDTKPVVVEDPDEVVLVHPTGAGSVTINRGELARLEPGEFLNDTLIELGLKMWLNDLRQKDPTLVDQIHVFSSFFFKKLDAGRGRGCDYNSVKKWTSKFDLFSKKFIIIPINEHLHWYLAVICFPEHVLKAPLPQPSAQPSRVTRSSDTATKAEHEALGSGTLNVEDMSPIIIEAGSPAELGKMETDADLAGRSEKMAIDSSTPVESQQDVVDVDPKGNDSPEVDVMSVDNEGEDESKVDGSHKTWILILDSLGGKHPRTVRILRQYLQAEAQERHTKVIDIKDARSSGGFVEDKHLSVPVQPNWCDCGIYLLHYVEVFYANPLEIIALQPGKKRKPKEVGDRYKELWKTDQVKEKRTAFRQILHKLSAEWLESKASSSKNVAPIPGTLPPSNNPTSNTLPHIETDVSILEIHPSEVTGVTAMTAAEPSTLASTLPSGLGYPSSTTTEDAPRRASSEDVAEVEGIVRSDQPSVDLPPTGEGLTMEARSSQSSSNTKPTRRGKKGGSKHGSKPSSESSLELNRGLESSPEL